MLVSLLPGCLASLLAVGACHDDMPLGIQADVQSSQQQDTVLVPIADTYIRQGSPNQNQGTEAVLRLQSSGHNRALLQWNPQAVAAAVAGGTLVSARIELTITDNGENWGASGRAIALHRLTQDWTELGATWNCAVDSVPTNQSPNCSGATAWEMGTPTSANPFAPVPTATAIMHNEQVGVVSFDVTGDLAAILTGQASHGWILKKVDEGQNGRVEFASRTAATAPRLVLSVASQSAVWPLLTNTYPSLDTNRVVAVAGDSVFVYLTNIRLRFNPGVADSAKAAYFARRGMTVLGVTMDGAFFVRIPDPGSTLQALTNALDQFRADPEIMRAIIIVRGLPGQDFVRFPTDGPGQARSNWLAASSGTWAMRSIRAPLAWGCETGAYGSPLARVGIFEWKHVPSHPEYASPIPRLWEPPNALVQSEKTTSPDTIALHAAHAVYTTGLLTAQGDNGSGIAGVNWRTQMHLYAGHSASNRRLPLTSAFYSLVSAIVSDDIRVLSVSADHASLTVPVLERVELYRELADDVRNLLTRSPSLIIVVAAGNERYRGTVSNYLTDPAAKPLRAGLLIVREDPAFRDRIIVVAGTQTGNQFWDFWSASPGQGSNYFLGATDIAAPAQDVSVLGPWAGQTGTAVPVTTRTGTSLAAPLVAGVAAQLLSMDSSLSPADVKAYLLRGSRQPRPNPQTGVLEPRVSLTGAPDVTYELDAYASLSLLASERTQTPICGFPVSLGLDAQGAYDGTVVLERPVVGPERILAPGHLLFNGRLSVAQGGRLISVFGFDEAIGQNFSVLMDHRGVSRGSVPDVFRQFLERDTLDQELRDAYWGTSYIRASDSTRSRTVNVFSLVGADANQCGANWSFAPDGLRMYVAMHCQFLPGASGQHLVTFDSSVAQIDPGLGLAVWSHDSRTVAIARYFDGTDFVPADLQLWSAAGALLGSVAAPGFGQFEGFTGDDVLLRTNEYSLVDPQCFAVTRVSQQLANQPIPSASISCDEVAAPQRQFPNVAVPGTAGASSRALGPPSNGTSPLRGRSSTPWRNSSRIAASRTSAN